MAVSIELNKGDIKKAIQELRKINRNLSEKAVRRILKKNSNPIVQAMISGSPSARIGRAIGKTTRKRSAPPFGVKIGVVKNSTTEFPDFSAPALASVIEYGTDERFRRTSLASAVSTGKITAKPWLRPAYDANESTFVRKSVKDLEDLGDRG